MEQKRINRLLSELTGVLLLIVGSIPAKSQVYNLSVGDTISGGVVAGFNSSTGDVLVLHPKESNNDWTDAGNWAAALSLNGYTDWRLPDLAELDSIYRNLGVINPVLSGIDATELKTSASEYYWSGSENGTNLAWYVFFGNGNVDFDYKLNARSVRAVRAFNLFNYLNKLENAGLVNAGGTDVRNSILWENKEQGGNIADYYGDKNEVWFTRAGTGVIAGTHGNKDVDPHFVSSGNYRLKNNSDMIDAGRNSDVPSGLTTDLDNQERVFGGRVDMGAYQSLIPVTIPNPLHVNGYSGLSETVLCDMETYDLSLTAKGDIYDYTWYRDGLQIATTTDSIYTIREDGTYTVDVNGVLDTVSSGPVRVRFSRSPVITKDLQDAAIVGGPVTLTVEATGPGLKYQWYFNNKPIAGAVTESLKVREEGNYFVRVRNECNEVESSTAYVTNQIPDPTVNRRVDLPQVAGIVTTPSAGTHYTRSQNDFVFEMWASAGYSLDYVTVTTDGGNMVEVEPSETEGRLRVTVKRVNTSIRILINGVSPVDNQSIHPDTRIWSYNGKLYISLPSAQEISVYTLTGTLHERRDLPAGDTVLSMPAGVYFVRFSDGTGSKIVIGN